MTFLGRLLNEAIQDRVCERQIGFVKVFFAKAEKPAQSAWNLPVNNC